MSCECIAFFYASFSPSVLLLGFFFPAKRSLGWVGFILISKGVLFSYIYIRLQLLPGYGWDAWSGLLFSFVCYYYTLLELFLLFGEVVRVIGGELQVYSRQPPPYPLPPLNLFPALASLLCVVVVYDIIIQLFFCLS